MKIPKIIHQIWVGPKEPPMHWINTWKNSSLEHILWNEEKLSSLKMFNQDKFDYFMNKKVYYGAADIARLEILYQYGGVYIDADTELLKPFPKEYFDYSFFAVEAYPDPRWVRRITNGILGAEKNSSIIKKYIDEISIAKRIEPCWKTIGGTLLTKVLLEDFKDKENIMLFRPEMFYPKGIDNQDSITKHYWGSTNNLY